MRRTTGSALDQNEGVILITTNSTLKIVHSELIMGAGIAKDAADMFPEMPIILGHEIIKRSGYNGYRRTFELEWYDNSNGSIPFRIFRNYHIILSPNVYDKRLTFGAFQTKREFWKPSPLELVLTSAERLAELIAGSEQLKNVMFHLPAPGTGSGGLDKEVVYNELVAMLPDNVVWYDYNGKYQGQNEPQVNQ